MRKLRLKTTLRGPEGDLPAGAEIVVDDAEARVLLAALGLAEDLGEAEPAPETPRESGASAPASAGAAAGDGGDTVAGTNLPEAEPDPATDAPAKRRRA